MIPPSQPSLILACYYRCHNAIDYLLTPMYVCHNTLFTVFIVLYIVCGRDIAANPVPFSEHTA
jgi:hypothetical protein